MTRIFDLLLPQLPPISVVLGRTDRSVKDGPTVLVNYVGKWQTGQLVHRHLKEEVDGRLVVINFLVGIQ